jgi:hypothetical protein
MPITSENFGESRFVGMQVSHEADVTKLSRSLYHVFEGPA